MNYIVRFKSLPKDTKRLLSLGIVMALFVALPLFVWAVVSQKFLISKKAQESQSIGQKTVNVLVIEFNPTMSSGLRLNNRMSWNDPQSLETQYIDKLKNVSNNYANYQIAERMVINDFTQLVDGYKYSETSYLNCFSNHSTCHEPSGVDYLKILNDYGVCDRVNSGEIQELWLWGGPWFGYWEANMAGVGAFNTNGPVVAGSSCNQKLHIMGFNYERGLPEMVEDFGHRFEGTMAHVFTYNGKNLWTKFVQSCGSLHIPPNGTSDYNWTNTNPVSSSCDDYLNYPNLTLASTTFGCEKWGCTDIGWKTYWLSQIPKTFSYTDNSWDNWWKYVLDYDTAITSTPLPTATPEESPTASPTMSPTASPTVSPTASPTVEPSQTPTPTPTPNNEPNSCGGTCGSNYNCKADLFCHDGFCRNAFCKDVTSCVCPTPTASVRPKPTPITSPSPISRIASPTPKTFIADVVSPTLLPTATPTIEVQQKPNLNFLLWIAGGSFSASIVLFLLML